MQNRGLTGSLQLMPALAQLWDVSLTAESGGRFGLRGRQCAGLVIGFQISGVL